MTTSTLNSLPLHFPSIFWELVLSMKCQFYFHLKKDFGRLSPVLFLLSPGKMLLICLVLKRRYLTVVAGSICVSWLLKHRLQPQFRPCASPSNPGISSSLSFQSNTYPCHLLVPHISLLSFFKNVCVQNPKQSCSWALSFFAYCPCGKNWWPSSVTKEVFCMVMWTITYLQDYLPVIFTDLK